MKIFIDVRPGQLYQINKDLKNRECNISPETEQILVCITQGIQKKCRRRQMEVLRFEQYFDEESI